MKYFGLLNAGQYMGESSLSSCWRESRSRRASNWNKKSDAKCLSGWVYATVAMIYSILSVILDFYYAIYPIVRILKLNMELRRKIGFAVMFGFGIV